MKINLANINRIFAILLLLSTPLLVFLWNSQNNIRIYHLSDGEQIKVAAHREEEFFRDMAAENRKIVKAEPALDKSSEKHKQILLSLSMFLVTWGALNLWNIHLSPRRMIPHTLTKSQVCFIVFIIVVGALAWFFRYEYVNDSGYGVYRINRWTGKTEILIRDHTFPVE